MVGSDVGVAVEGRGLGPAVGRSVDDVGAPVIAGAPVGAGMGVEGDIPCSLVTDKLVGTAVGDASKTSGAALGVVVNVKLSTSIKSEAGVCEGDDDEELFPTRA